MPGAERRREAVAAVVVARAVHVRNAPLRRELADNRADRAAARLGPVIGDVPADNHQIQLLHPAYVVQQTP